MSRLAIVGPRDLHLPPSEMVLILDRVGDIEFVEEIVTGDAMGIDRSAIRFAKSMGIPWVAFGAGWGELGTRAGPERNRRIAMYLDPCEDRWLAITDERTTKGTANATKQLMEANIEGAYHRAPSLARYRQKRKPRAEKGTP